MIWFTNRSLSTDCLDMVAVNVAKALVICCCKETRSSTWAEVNNAPWTLICGPSVPRYLLGSRVRDLDWAIRRDGLGAFHGCRHLQMVGAVVH